jgi:hypothetical protein
MEERAARGKRPAFSREGRDRCASKEDSSARQTLQVSRRDGHLLRSGGMTYLQLDQFKEAGIQVYLQRIQRLTTPGGGCWPPRDPDRGPSANVVEPADRAIR